MEPTLEDIKFDDLEKTDVITVELVPEKKGLILKHYEYYVSSRRHGTTVTRRYRDFVHLHDILLEKYPYRSISTLPPKGYCSPTFMKRRRLALQHWLTLVATHPVLAHDADTRAFLCEVTLRLDKPKHDEFTLAGLQPKAGEMTTNEMQAVFEQDKDYIKLIFLAIDRIIEVFEKVEERYEKECGDIRQLGAVLAALSAPNAMQAPDVRETFAAAATLSSSVHLDPGPELAEVSYRLVLCMEALRGYRALCSRLGRGLHAEQAAAAHAPTVGAAGCMLRDRHRYALRCALEEARWSRAYITCCMRSLPALFRAHAAVHAQGAQLWTRLDHALTPR